MSNPPQIPAPADQAKRASLTEIPRTIEELTAAHPKEAPLIKAPPLTECPHCGGTGEYRNRKQAMVLCPCTCISGTDETRRAAVTAFRQAITDIAAALRQRLGR